MKFHILAIYATLYAITVASPTPQLVVDLDACAKQQGNTCDPEIGCGCPGLFCDTTVGPKGFGICISTIIPPMLPPLPDDAKSKPATPTKA